MSYVVPLWNPPALKIKDSDDEFPVRRVHCVAKNYGDHIREMGGDPNKIKPKFFSKSAHAVAAGVDEVSIEYPRATSDLHFEVELVVALGESAEVFGYGLGIDFTKRDLQAVAKESGMPWDTSKNFTGAAAVSKITPIAETGELSEGAITLAVNGEIKQEGNLNQMIYNVAEIMEHLEGYDELLPGDIIFTGTPAGVGAVQKGDVMTCTLAGLDDFKVTLA
ncbi:fumarylacetoacetate hydrolase family protein [Terasakiella sp. A23]|uniref:fumarylacetoacetate hydrolase family protein n=1 Tax=Terasakiella sp. FCG-A23 TaxID=3080561 RepID=UPI0029540EBE|nr:fumarylacetoacetate hydrolase family protein [Terasakiella sp. A23]MDV7338068.1 fumarylacetoacetate hydrolase family protein [Terasakiella sp. A23]